MISQTEYDSPVEEKRDAQQRVLMWLGLGALVCTIVLVVAYGWVFL